MTEASKRGALHSDLGAAAEQEGRWKEESDGECANDAQITLAEAVEATSLVLRPALVKAVIDAAKLSGSIGPCLGPELLWKLAETYGVPRKSIV